jgi:acyl carrier protein
MVRMYHLQARRDGHSSEIRPSTQFFSDIARDEFDDTAVRPFLGDGFYCLWGLAPTQRMMLAPNAFGCQRCRHGHASHATLSDMSTSNSLIVALDAVTQQIIDLIGNDAGTADLTPESSLQSQGLDSLKVMSLVFRIEEHYDIVLDEEDADDLRTVGDLAALVVRRIERQS